jgi:hypothetical protein
LAFNPGAKNSHGGWQHFSYQRTALRDWLMNATNGIKNVVFVSGDLHSGGAIDDGQAEDPSKPFPEISVPHTNITGTSPFETYDTGCAAGQSGTWKIGTGSNNYITGDPNATTATCGSLTNKGPGFVLLRVDNNANPKTMTLEVRDANTDDVVKLTYTLNLQ